MHQVQGTHFRAIARVAATLTTDVINQRVTDVGALTRLPAVLTAVTTANRDHERMVTGVMNTQMQQMEQKWNTAGIILITVPTIQYGGYFLLTSLMNKSSGYMENPLRQNFFRAGHAHAGVIVILSLVCQILADAAVLPIPLLWFVRIGIPLSAILISAGFFFSVLPPTATQASGAVSLIYFGAAILAIGVVGLAIGLLRSPQLA